MLQLTTIDRVSYINKINKSLSIYKEHLFSFTTFFFYFLENYDDSFIDQRLYYDFSFIE